MYCTSVYLVCTLVIWNITDSEFMCLSSVVQVMDVYNYVIFFFRWSVLFFQSSFCPFKRQKIYINENL